MNKNDGRYEIKFILNETDSATAKYWLSSSTSLSQSYPSRQVHSLYFDNNEFQSVKDNLAGISNRLKIRLRWYQTDDIKVSAPILELKSREGRLGYKQHIPLPELQTKIMETPISEIITIIKNQVINTALGCSIFDQQLNPSLYVHYSRSYYENFEGIRATEDEKIQFSYITPSKKLSELSTVRYPLKVLELKFAPEEKNEVTNWLKSLYLVPKRHSKYLTGLAIFGLATYI